MVIVCPGLVHLQPGCADHFTPGHAFVSELLCKHVWRGANRSEPERFDTRCDVWRRYDLPNFVTKQRDDFLWCTRGYEYSIPALALYAGISCFGDSGHLR